MRITILQGAFLPVPPLRGGAVEKMWFELGKHFSRRGHAVVHVSRSFPGLPLTDTLEGVFHRRVPGSDFPRSVLLSKWRDLVYSQHALRVLPPADILVTNTFWMPILASRSQHRFGRIVVDVERMPKGQMRFYHRSACLRANSLAVQQAISREAPALASRIRLIPNSLPFWPIQPSFTARKKLLLYAGRLHPEKGIELLLHAFRLAFSGGMHEWSLRLVGPADISMGGGGLTWLKKLLTSPDLTGLPIEWLGPVSDSQRLNQHYCESSIFVYPSLAERGETFGLAPLEAMATGAVPIVSKLECFTDFIESGSNGLIFDHRSVHPAQQLANAMLCLAADSSLLSRLSSRATSVRLSHNPSIIADRFLSCFHDLLADGMQV